MTDKHRDYGEFMEAQVQTPSSQAHQRVLGAVHGDLKRFPLQVYLKVMLIHAVVGGLTLLFCPQFGIGPFAGQFGLIEILMRYGTIACSVTCGAIFLGFSGFFTSLIFRAGELGYLRKNRVPVYATVAAGSLVTLSVAEALLRGRSLMPNADSILFNLLWLAAAVFFASLATSLGASLRSLLPHIQPTDRG